MTIIRYLSGWTTGLTSSSLGTNPICNVRRDKKTRQHIFVSCRHLVGAYNNLMGGVNLNDIIIAFYRISMRAEKKSFKRVFFCILRI